MKAVPIAQKGDLALAANYIAVADRILFDARAPKDATRPGGLGKAFDWRLLKNLALGVPFMLSGGLDAGNVGEALRVTKAPGVDVSSGVERAPGEKDPDKIRAFIRAARKAAFAGPAGRGEVARPLALTLSPTREREGYECGLCERVLTMTIQQPNSFRTGPDDSGHFGIYGGRFVAETLMPLILELEEAYAKAKVDPQFKEEMDGYLTHYVGRPSPLYFAERLTAHCSRGCFVAARRSISSARSSITPARTR